jgi:hypothetical protein
VQTSDGIGFANATLARATCTPSGRLLQPSRPMTALDGCFAAAAFGAAAGPAAAQTFPTKQIRTVVTCPTRGGPHELARTGAVEISKSAKVVTDSDANAE